MQARIDFSAVIANIDPRYRGNFSEFLHYSVLHNSTGQFVDAKKRNLLMAYLECAHTVSYESVRQLCDLPQFNFKYTHPSSG